MACLKLGMREISPTIVLLPPLLFRANHDQLVHIKKKATNRQRSYGLVRIWMRRGEKPASLRGRGNSSHKIVNGPMLLESPIQNAGLGPYSSQGDGLGIVLGKGL